MDTKLQNKIQIIKVNLSFYFFPQPLKNAKPIPSLWLHSRQQARFGPQADITKQWSSKWPHVPSSLSLLTLSLPPGGSTVFQALHSLGSRESQARELQ